VIFKPADLHDSQIAAGKLARAGGNDASAAHLVDEVHRPLQQKNPCSGTTAVNFGAYLLDKIGGREARQDQAGNENGTDDRFRSIQR
jgi:hypothetical protein